MPKLTIDELNKLNKETKKNIYLRNSDFKSKVTVHMGTCGIAAGARGILSVFIDGLNEKNITDIMITTSGCAGLCSSEPMITVELLNSPPVKYGNLTPEKAKKILEEHLISGKVVREYAIGIGSERTG